MTRQLRNRTLAIVAGVKAADHFVKLLTRTQSYYLRNIKYSNNNTRMRTSLYQVYAKWLNTRHAHRGIYEQDFHDCHFCRCCYGRNRTTYLTGIRCIRLDSYLADRLPVDQVST